MNEHEASPTAETYAEFQEAFRFFNERLYDGRLPPCLITLQRRKSTFGYFSKERFVNRATAAFTDEIAMNPAFFAVRTTEQTLSTLVHEMAHLWQARFGDGGRRRYHNREWADKMESLGLMPSSTAAPGGSRVGDHVSHYIIPDGRYEVAAKELLATGLFVSWLDRFPYVAPLPQLPVGAPAGEPGGEENPPSEARREIVPSDELGALIALPQPPVNGLQNNSGRVKLRCPNCGAQAWGKPSLKLLCGEEDCGGEPMLLVG